MNKVRKLGLTFGLLLVLSLCVGFFAFAFADDTTAVPAVATTLQMQPAHTPALTAAAPTLAALPAMPATHDFGSIALWILGVLSVVGGWVGFFSSELLAVFPNCKWNGWLHGIMTAFGAFSTDGDNTVSLRLDKIESAIAEIKASPAATAPGA